MRPDLPKLPAVDSEYLFRQMSGLYEVYLVCGVESHDGDTGVRAE